MENIIKIKSSCLKEPIANHFLSTFSKLAPITWGLSFLLSGHFKESFFNRKIIDTEVSEAERHWERSRFQISGTRTMSVDFCSDLLSYQQCSEC